MQLMIEKKAGKCRGPIKLRISRCGIKSLMARMEARSERGRLVKLQAIRVDLFVRILRFVAGTRQWDVYTRRYRLARHT